MPNNEYPWRGGRFIIACCKGCTAPKRYPGCSTHCKEYQEARAEYNRQKAEYRQKYNGGERSISQYDFERVSGNGGRNKK